MIYTEVTQIRGKQVGHGIDSETPYSPGAGEQEQYLF